MLLRKSQRFRRLDAFQQHLQAQRVLGNQCLFSLFAFGDVDMRTEHPGGLAVSVARERGVSMDLTVSAVPVGKTEFDPVVWTNWAK